jgi:endoglucanase
MANSTVSSERRALHLDWLKRVTMIPSAAGHEGRVVAWIERWLGERPDVAVRHDRHGNIELRLGAAAETDAPIYFTAHLDHPTFVVDEVLSPTTLVLGFRGGVMADYFPQARVRVHVGDSYTLGTITGEHNPDGTPWSETDDRPFKQYVCETDGPHYAEAGRSGDIASWDLPPQQVIDDEFGGILHTDACDDLAAVAGALAAFDELRLMLAAGVPVGDVRVLFTRAEEIGFIGAIGAARDGFMPRNSRIIALENSRSFPESPIHGGPIVRVGDRVSVFSPELTAAVAKVAETIAGGPSTPTAAQKNSEMPKWKWQRKLMAGGACEASVFCAYGYTSTCVCLPLGNYHNMANLGEVQAGTYQGTPRVGREHIGVDDFHGMVDLLIGCGRDLPATSGFNERLEKLWTGRRFVLDSVVRA